MKIKNLKEKITGFHYKKTFLFLELPLYILFFIPSVFYSLIINLKNFFYKIEVLKEGKSKAKIICIGNLTTGGVGKTPIVIEFCKYLSAKGKKIASLSRGYGGKLKGINVIKDFESNILSNDASIIGDEVQLIAQNSTPEHNFAVITSSNRLNGANYAYENLGAEVILMDDGFSNRKIKKDLTILLFDSEKFIGNGFLLPLGPLRESLSEAKRADIIIIVDKNSNKNLSGAIKFLEEKFKKPVFVSKFIVDYFYNIKTGEKIESTAIKDVFTFCGIGSPEQFYNYLKDFNLIGKKSYNDHYSYKKEDIETILNEAKNAKYIITTEKDAVKIKDLIPASSNIFAMKLKPELDFESILKDFTA